MRGRGRYLLSPDETQNTTGRGEGQWAKVSDDKNKEDTRLADKSVINIRGCHQYAELGS